MTDYAFYCTEYGGSQLTQEEFPLLEKRACEVLYDDTAGRSEGVLSVRDARAVRMAVCAVAEALAAQRRERAHGGALASESVGDWTRTYAAPACGETPQTRIFEAERRYLGLTGLLYRGRERRV